MILDSEREARRKTIVSQESYSECEKTKCQNSVQSDRVYLTHCIPDGSFEDSRYL